MDRIKRYVDSLYKNITVNSEDITEMKEEVKVHLMETVMELQAQGKSEDESIEIAISRFGESEKLGDEFESVFNPKKIFGKGILIVSSILLLASIISYYIITPITNKQLQVSGELNNEICNLISNSDFNNNELLTNDIKNVLSKYGREFKYIAIYRLPNDFVLDGNGFNTYNYPMSYINPKDTPIDIVKNDKEDWAGGYFEKNNTEKWVVKVGMNHVVNLYNTLRPIPFILFSIYMFCFVAWTLINFKQLRRKNKSYAVLFTIFNITLFCVCSLVVFNIYHHYYFDNLGSKFAALFILINVPAFLLLRLEYKNRFKVLNEI